MQIKELSFDEIDMVSGARVSISGSLASGFQSAVDYGGRGAMIGSIVGVGLFSPEFAGAFMVAGAVYGMGVGLMNSM